MAVGPLNTSKGTGVFHLIAVMVPCQRDILKELVCAYELKVTRQEIIVEIHCCSACTQRVCLALGATLGALG